MSKKKGKRTRAEGPHFRGGVGDAPGECEADAPQPEEPEDLQLAREAVRRAKAKLRKAQNAYRDVREGAAERVKKVRESTVGDAIDGTLKLVRKHPGPSVIVAALLGFFLGRLFRR